MRIKARQQAPGFVRIVGGKWRRRRIELPQDADLRPTPDRVRETLFNWLDPVIAGSRCLDLFAGSGALAFEALSRGASEAVLVEQSRRAADALERHRDQLTADAEIVCASAEDYLRRNDPAAFDIVFVDPPYSVDVTPILESLASKLTPGARVYLERDRNDAWPETTPLRWYRRSRAGAVEFGIAELEPGP